LDGIAAFITPYLEAGGVRLGLWWRASRWLKSLGARGAAPVKRPPAGG